MKDSVWLRAMVLEWTMATQSSTPATNMWDTVKQCQCCSYLEVEE